MYIYDTVLNSWVTNFSPALGRSPGGMRVHPGPLSKTARSPEDAGHPDMCNTFVGSESEYISQSMCLSSNPTASEGSLAPRKTSIIPKHRETSPVQVRVKTMWEMIKREGTLRIANPSAAGVPESKKPI